MIKFIEKIFSGLAYQIGKFLFFVLLAIAICFIVDKDKLLDIVGLRVYADSMQFKLNDTNQTDYIFYYNCSNSTTCTTNFATASITNGGRSYFHNIDNMTVGTSGINIVYTTNQKFQPGYMYSINSYVCYTNANNLTGEVHIGNTAASALNSSMAYSVTTRSANNSSVSNWYVSAGGTSLKNQISASYCSYFSTVFSPNVTGEWVSLHLTRSSVSSGDKIFFIGYQVANLGAYNPSLASSITQVINNTATETQEQVKALNTKISNMLSEQETTNNELNDLNDKQEETNEKLDDIKDSITDSDTSDSNANDFFDSSSIVSGNDGVVSTLLTLPIQMSSKLVDNLGGTCTPYHMNFGMLGKSYTLDFPCIDLKDYLGYELWRIIDLLFCGFMAYNISMLFVSIYDSITSLQDYYYSYIYQSSHEEHTRENRRSRTPSE